MKAPRWYTHTPKWARQWSCCGGVATPLCVLDNWLHTKRIVIRPLCRLHDRFLTRQMSWVEEQNS